MTDIEVSTQPAVNSLRILVVAQRFPYPPNKGEKIRTFHQIEFLRASGHDVFLCCPRDGFESFVETNDFSQRFGIYYRSGRLANKYLRYFFGLIRGKPLSVANFYSKELQQIIDSLIASTEFDCVICTSSSMAEYLFESKSFANRDRKPKMIMDFMDLDSAKWEQYESVSKPPMSMIYRREARLLSRYEVRVFEHFDSCLFISDAEARLFVSKNRLSDYPVVVGNGICTRTFTPSVQSLEETDPILLFTGVMSYKPNVDAVIWFSEKVWPKVRLRYDHARLIIAGMDPEPGVEKLARNKGIEVTGFVEDIVPYYHCASIFIAPLRIARGVQNKILQAFACGLPVIATRMGAEGIDCTDGKNILIADSPEEFFECIVKLHRDRDLRLGIRENALSLVKARYSWEGKLRKLAEILP